MEGADPGHPFFKLFPLFICQHPTNHVAAAYQANSAQLPNQPSATFGLRLIKRAWGDWDLRGSDQIKRWQVYELSYPTATHICTMPPQQARTVARSKVSILIGHRPHQIEATPTGYWAARLLVGPVLLEPSRQP